MASLADQINEHLSSPMDLPDVFWEYSIQKWLADAPVFPFSQVFGYVLTNALPATTIATDEARSTASYADLATVGPTLSGVPDGNYIVIFGCTAHNPSGTGDARMSIQVNGTSATDTDAVIFSGGNTNVSLMRAIPKALSNSGSNTITAKYKGDGSNNSNFQNRWMFALRYGNL